MKKNWRLSSKIKREMEIKVSFQVNEASEAWSKICPHKIRLILRQRRGVRAACHVLPFKVAYTTCVSYTGKGGKNKTPRWHRIRIWQESGSIKPSPDVSTSSCRAGSADAPTSWRTPAASAPASGSLLRQTRSWPPSPSPRLPPAKTV